MLSNLPPNFVTTSLDQIFQTIFAQPNPFTFDELIERFATGIHLPRPVADMNTGEPTWTATSESPDGYISTADSEARDTWELPYRPIHDLREIIELWQTINPTTTNRHLNSVNVHESDLIYGCENIYRCLNCYDSKNLFLCDDCNNSELLLASSRSGHSELSIALSDSANCSGSLSVLYSNKIVNSFFIQDCFDMFECMFCSHLASKKFYIANMEFPEDEYYAIKSAVISWLLQK